MVTLSFDINSAYFSVVACVVECFSVVVVVLLRDILGVNFVVDGVVDDDFSNFGVVVAAVVVVRAVVVVVTLTDVLFAILTDSQFDSVVLIVSISLFTIPVLHSGTHMMISMVSCVQMSNGRPFLVNAIRFIFGCVCRAVHSVNL